MSILGVKLICVGVAVALGWPVPCLWTITVPKPDVIIP